MVQNKIIDSIDFEEKGKLMYRLAERLYPICRSITGNGVRETLAILKEFIPLELTEVPSGTKVLGWEIPDEWNIKDAWIKDSAGNKIIDFRELNLHVLNYSIPVDQIVDLERLKKHVYTLPEHPQWVPYRTAYHKRQWGFSMAHSHMETLKEDNYHIKIDSEICPGELTYGEFFIPGKTNEEVLISCHICHPSLCNDNLSGIVIATYIAQFLKTLETRFSYRFLFIPATIGSITWLSRNEDKLQNIKYGLVLTLLGDTSAFHYKKTRRGDAEIDKIMDYLLKNESNSKILEFSPYGYDERQFCSPGFNLPVGRLTRTPNGEFPEYHTSADNLDFINPISLGESFKFLLEVIALYESNVKYINLNPKGEPHLGDHGLYKPVGGQSLQKVYQMALLWILNFSDGDNSLLDIAIRSGIDFPIISDAALKLQHSSLISVC